MGNRRKLRINGKRNNSLRQKKNPSVLQRGIAAINKSSDRPHIPTADEIFSATGDISPYLPEDAVPASDGAVIKTVPAKHKGVTVGDAHIHDDGLVTIVFHKDAPQWALDEIKATSDKIGYSLEDGEYHGPS